MKKLKLLIAGMIFLGSAAMAQEPILHFETTHHDFGTIKEDDGPVTYRFKLSNTGTSNLKLTKVQPACGCTTSNWTKDSISPGKDGYVDATYDVTHRPGAFNKSITVYDNAKEKIVLLTFSGTVIPHVKTLMDSFPTESGNIRFANNNINFAHISNNVTDTFQNLLMLNTGNTPIVIKEINVKAASYIFAKDLPFTVPPHAKVKLAIHYNVAQTHDYGIKYDEITLITTDDKSPNKRVTILADIHQFVPPMTDAEKANAAHIFFPENKHDFGDVKQGDAVSYDFSFTNKGKSELTIYKVKTSCGCTVTEPKKMKLAPGETSSIKVTFNSAGHNGKDEKEITVYSNDPVTAEYSLKIVSNISLKGKPETAPANTTTAPNDKKQ